MPSHTVHLGITQWAVLAFFLLLLPKTAFCLEDNTQGVSIYELAQESTPIHDLHGRLGRDERMKLEDLRNEFWKNTGLRLSVVIIAQDNSLETFDSFSGRIVKALDNGKSGRTDDIVLVVDPNARRAFLDVDKRLSKDFPPGSIETLINNKINPALMKEGLVGGITKGINGVTSFMVQHNRTNRSIFIHGYGAVAAIGIFLAGMLLRRRWGATNSAFTASACFGAVVGFDAFNSGFAWYEVLSFVILTAPFLGMFVWIGMGNDLTDNTANNVRPTR